MKRTIRTAFLLAVALTFAGAANLAAQGEQSPFEGKRVIGIEPTEADKIALARRLMSARRFQEATDLLEMSYEAEPDNSLIRNLLKNCYEQLQQYDKAVMLARRIVEKEPHSDGHLLYLAELLVKLDLHAEAMEVYDKVAEMNRDLDPIRSLILIGSLVRSHLDDRALEQIDEARQQHNDPGLFSLERGAILERRRQYRQAAREYLPLLLEDTTSNADRAERKLTALLRFEESAGSAEGILTRVADSTSSLRIMRLLADHYLRGNQLEEAFAYTLRQDSLEGLSGYPLIDFMRRCHERKRWPQVVRMADIILTQYPRSGFEAEVSFEYAGALARLGRAEEAIAVYDRLFRRSPHGSIKAGALYGIGVIHLEFLDDIGAALVYFDSVVNHYPHGENYIYARRTIPRCYLRQRRLDQAREKYRELQEAGLPEVLSEEVAFFLGLVDFFDRQYDSAETALRKLMVDYPQGFFVNDALRLIMAVDEAGDSKAVLDDYAAARYHEFCELDDSAAVKLYAIADAEAGVLGDVALYRLIGLELLKADSAAALRVIDRLAEEHPESYYRPWGLKIKADIKAEADSARQEAGDLYRQLLEDYPEYPFAREVREKLRRLEDPRPVG